MNRRDLLKYFGIGTVITPTVDGLPKVEAAARLIEPPKVEIVENIRPPMFCLPEVGEKVECMIYMKCGKFQSTVCCDMITNTSRMEVVDVTTHSVSTNLSQTSLFSPGVIHFSGKVVSFTDVSFMEMR